jgi:hypothetical protein
MRRLLPKNKILLNVILVVLLTLPAIISLLKPGFFPTDDGEWMVVRLSDFHRSVVAGQLPVRWAARLNNQFGYPVFNFLYPLSLYWGELFHLIGFSFVWSIKLVFIFSFILAAIFMYLFTAEAIGPVAGIISAVFYTYTPYRLLDVYVRGSIGEAVSFVFIPLIFWAVYKISQKQKKIFMAIGSLSFGALIMSHNIMAMIFTPFILAYMLFLYFKNKSSTLLLFYFFTLILGLAVSCFFWLPAVYDKQFIILDSVEVANPLEHFPTIKQLLIPSWGYGPSIVGSGDKASYQLGPMHLFAVGVVFLILDWQTELFLAVFFIACFLMLPISSPVWQYLPMMNRIQFPWRLLALTSFTAAFLAGGLGRIIKKKKTLSIAVVLLVILINFNYARPSSFFNRPDSFYATNEATTTVKDEYLPIWVKEKQNQRAAQKVDLISGRGEVKNLVFNSKQVAFGVYTGQEIVVQINTVYFPGWIAKIDDQPAAIDYQNNQGLMQLKVPPGEHQVLFEFNETPVRLFADIVSIVGFVFIAGLFIGGIIKSAKDK